MIAINRENKHVMEFLGSKTLDIYSVLRIVFIVGDRLIQPSFHSEPFVFPARHEAGGYGRTSHVRREVNCSIHLLYLQTVLIYLPKYPLYYIQVLMMHI